VLRGSGRIYKAVGLWYILLNQGKMTGDAIMSLFDRIKTLFGKKETPRPAESPRPVESPKPARPQKVCKGCGKTFSYDPSWEHIPNFCRDCKKKFSQEKEEKQRSGAPRKISRKCKACGRYFTFPNTLEHYPSYCLNCRKKHQAEMKQKYARTKA